MDRTTSWLTLYRVPGLGARRIKALITRFGSAPEVLAAGQAAWRDAGLTTQICQALRTPDQTGVAADLAWLDGGENRHLIPLDHAAYPARLRELADPPPLLFILGDPELLALPQLAIVGSRNPTGSGRRNAEAFAEHLAARGLTICSGLAHGIDSCAHRGALAAGGFTTAVMGTGIDRIYPARNRELAHQIVAAGALISELPPGASPKAENFPRRNRIISGLSLGTLVVEAAIQSGSLVTARHAVEQGREVFAIPGSIHTPQARGCHQLLREGAKLVESAEHILEELPLAGLSALVGSQNVAVAGGDEQQSATESVDPDYQQLLNAMGNELVTVDQMVAAIGLPVATISSMLLRLELDGKVHLEAGGRYQLICHPTVKRAT